MAASTGRQPSPTEPPTQPPSAEAQYWFHGTGRGSSMPSPVETPPEPPPAAPFRPDEIERLIREWFGYRLISEKDSRLPVMLAEDETGGLPPGVLADLGATYLIRKEPRSAFAWIELAHDRLIDPVRKSNNTWFAGKLTAFQRRASRWNGQGRSPKFLLTDGEINTLIDGEQWADKNPVLVAQVDRDFLAASKAALTPVGRVRRFALAHRKVLVICVVYLVFFLAQVAACGSCISTRTRASG